jgi:hypothetical protein
MRVGLDLSEPRPGPFENARVYLHLDLLVEMVVALVHLGENTGASDVPESVAEFGPEDARRRVVPILQVGEVGGVWNLFHGLRCELSERAPRSEIKGALRTGAKSSW